MLKPAAWAAVPGKNPAEKLGRLGLFPGKSVDIRKLASIADNYGVTVYLFFEEDLARTKSLAEVLAEYAGVPEYERPVIQVESFLRFTQENDPSFEQTMDEFPLMVEIVTIGEIPSGSNVRPEPCVSCLMPFLDELDVSAELPEPGVHEIPPAKK
ncbi:hypothetical protein [Methanoregula sp.]|uniref:hypothetical protein n=1 Tax=Methanoregula sp. TaxID=2052170 RepID=UPI00236F36FE|nr:hypothetical protein [Methanoregula sp.]MDD1687526.1 hypothetical protein [Methanoregula sp.]